MSRKRKLCFLSAALALACTLPVHLHAQVEKISTAEQARYLQELQAYQTNGTNPQLKAHLQKQQKAGNTAAVNAIRTAKAVGTAKLDSPMVWFDVPAMSEYQRLPDLFPVDGEALKPVRIIMAQEEYEPGSFVVYPLKDLGKVQLSLSEFKTAEGTVFPDSGLDLKVVKVWYQNGNGWYSYFGDHGLKLTPELLLNDEDLIKVDTEKVQNYARLTDPKTKEVSHVWISAPEDFDKRFVEHYRNTAPFQPMKENFRDAKTLQPVLLNEGEFKQFFLTAHATAKTAPGLYKGSIVLKEKSGKTVGTIPASVKVLPFSLPEPKSKDMKRDYITMSYNYTSFSLIAEENGGDFELARKQLEWTLANQARHGQKFHWIRGGVGTGEFLEQIGIMKKAGCRTDYIFANVGMNPEDARDFCMKHLGHTNVFLGFGDEPPARWFIQHRNFFKSWQKEGFKFIIAAGEQAFHAAGYFFDFFNYATTPENEKAPYKWNEIGNAWVAWYATHHVGPENPAFNRRQYGIAPYLSGFSATCNYAHHYGAYNDRRSTYKPMVFAYGCYDGVIDTIQWEGYREGIDDIRYATLLRSLANEAIQSKDVNIRHKGGVALQFMAEIDKESDNLNKIRLEMIRHILNLKDALAK